MTVRRIAAKVAIAGVGLLAVAGLSACRVESGAALFVQDERVGEDRVDAIVESAPENLSTNGQQAQIGDLRQAVLKWLTVTELAERVAADTGAVLPGPDYAGMAEQLGTTPDNEFARLYAQSSAWQDTLVAGAEPRQATEADAESIAAHLALETGEDTTGLAEQILPIISAPDLAPKLGERDAIEALLEKYDVLANPRYGSLEIDITAIQTPSGYVLPIAAPIPTTAT
ncbi:MAG TPA: hypothetical protein VGF17_11665 [Phytomonospora sp.]